MVSNTKFSRSTRDKKLSPHIFDFDVEDEIDPVTPPGLEEVEKLDSEIVEEPRYTPETING